MTDTFSVLIESGYLFKYKDIVWQPVATEEADDEDESSCKIMSFSEKKKREESQYYSPDRRSQNK